MQHITFRFPSRSITKEEVISFECLIGRPLPSDYKRFILDQGCGEAPNLSLFRIESGEESSLKRLYPVNGDDGFDLTGMFVQMKDALPDGVIRIGHDSFGNPICLALTEDLANAVLWMDHERRNEEGEDRFGNLFFCARSFSEFIDSLSEETWP